MQISNGKVGLYEIFLRRLKQAKETCKREILPFPVVFRKLCLSFSLTKKECWDILFILRDNEFIGIVPFHGVRINEN